MGEVFVFMKVQGSQTRGGREEGGNLGSRGRDERRGE